MKRVVQKRHAYRVLVGKPDGRRPVGGRMPQQQDNIEMGLERRRMGWEGVDRMRLRTGTGGGVFGNFHKMRGIS
jgi:hypothetical protein